MDVSYRKLACALAFLIVAGVGSYLTHVTQAMARHEQQLLMTEIVSTQASVIERRLDQSLSSTDILAHEVIQRGGEFDDFEDYANEMLRSIGGISNLQLAPGGVVQRIYPLAGNEKALGHNILVDDSRRQEAERAIEERRLTLAGPFELIQGGIAIIGRNPVFFSKGGKDQFWGFVSVLMHLEELLRATEMDQLESKGYSFRLSKTHPDTGQPEVFASSVKELTSASQSAVINVPDGTWVLSMSRAAIGHDLPILFGYATSLVLAALAAWALGFVLLQPAKLQAIVKQKTIELEELAFYDHLTGLANRRLLSEQLDQMSREAVRYHKAIAFLYLDLDDFKRVNDTLGHEAGDRMLKQIAERLGAVVRDSDLVARLGGDEFGILLLDTESVRDVTQIATKVIAAIEDPLSIEHQEFVVSTSVGITMIPADGQKAVDILKNADMAMYAAKKAGKRHYSFFDQALQNEALEKIRIENDLNDGIDHDQFVLHYQPLIDLDSENVVGYEALIRWQHPVHGLLFPDRFIGVAEETGKIVEIGYWVIREASATIAKWVAEQRQWRHIAVNLSPRQFADPNLLDNIRTILRQANIDARCLEVEITESTVMANTEDAIRTLEELRRMGIAVAIDDFGTGYSSLAMLRRLPVDKLKIDRAFVLLLESARSDRKIVESLISMAHALNIRVVAEGVETAGQLELLRRFGCDFGQGYLFSKPVPLEQLQQPVDTA